MNVSPICHVYMQPQTKTLNEKQKDNVKTAAFQQSDFSPALLLSANMNRISFGNGTKNLTECMRNICKNNMAGAEDLAGTLLEQMYNVNPQALKRVLDKCLKNVHDQDVEHFAEIRESVDFLSTVHPPKEAYIRKHYLGC